MFGWLKVRRRASFVEETLSQLRCVETGLYHSLESDVALKSRIFREVHLPHASKTKHLDDPVRSDGRVFHGESAPAAGENTAAFGDRQSRNRHLLSVLTLKRKCCLGKVGTGYSSIRDLIASQKPRAVQIAAESGNVALHPLERIALRTGWVPCFSLRLCVMFSPAHRRHSPSFLTTSRDEKPVRVLDVLTVRKRESIRSSGRPVRFPNTL